VYDGFGGRGGRGAEAEAGAGRRRAGYFIFLVGGGNAGVSWRLPYESFLPNGYSHSLTGSGA
jgi:hypothetical protein